MASEYCLTDLPEHVLFKVISFASFEDIRALCLVSKRMNEICKLQMRSRQILLNRPKLYWEETALLQDMESIYASTIFHRESSICVDYNTLIHVLKNYLPNIRYLCVVDIPEVEENDYLYGVQGINDTNIHLLAETLPNLTYLWIANFGEVTDFGLSRLFAKLRNLKTLSLHYCSLKGTCFKHLPNLDRLYISEYWEPDFTNFPYERLQSCLKQLYLNCCYSYFGETLSKLKSLQTVAFDLSEILINEGMPQIFTQVSRHERIEHLCIRVSKKIECDIDSLAICENIKSLTIVSTRYSFEYCVSDAQLKKLIARFPNLECLRLRFELSSHYAFDLIDFCEARKFPQIMNEIKQLKNLRCFDLVLLREVCGRYCEECLRYCEEDHESGESDKKPENSDKDGVRYAFSLFDCENISKFRFGFFDSTIHFSDYCRMYFVQNARRTFLVQLFSNESVVEHLDTPVQIFNSTNKLWKDFGSNILGFHQKYHDVIANYYCFDPKVLQANLDYMKNLTTE